MELANQDLSDTHKHFTHYKWILIKNTFNEVIYKKNIYDLDEFIIKIYKNNIDLYIPFKDNNIFKTSFDNFYDANKFLLFHLKYYEFNNNNNYNNYNNY